MKKLKHLLGSFLCMAICVIIGCREEIVTTPKPRMYPRVFYPEKSVATYTTADCPFTFDYAGYNNILRDTFIFDGKPSSDCWFDLHTKSLNASLHCSYYEAKSPKDISSHIDDAFQITGNHNIKANYRKEDAIQNKYGVTGLMFSLEGPVASPLQFYLTDNKNHFFRASLYFNAKVNPDSTAAILAFMKPDIELMISSFKWK